MPGHLPRFINLGKWPALFKVYTAIGSDKPREQNDNLEKPGRGNFSQGSTTITKAIHSPIDLLLDIRLLLKNISNMNQ